MQDARESLGLPPSRLSSSFWTHIMEKEKIGSNSPSQSSLPLLTPLDKNATATRLLLHDTQANLEKFSGKVDKLLEGFFEAKSEVKLIKTLFERDRETLTNDVIDLVNRCQTQIQNSLGSPAQSSVVDQFFKDVSRLLENLDKRLDAMQTLSQTHAQNLQTQIQAIQIIQEQQCTILSTLTPLMPLLQAIPLHIDLAKNFVIDALQKKGFTDAKSVQTSPILHTPGIRNSNKRPRASSRSDDPAPPTSQINKRFCKAREVTTQLPAVRNHNDPKPDSRRQSLRSNPQSSILADRFRTPSQKSKTVDSGLRNSLTPSKHIHRSTRSPLVSALGDRANTLQPATTKIHISTNTLSGLTTLDRNASIHGNRMPSVSRPATSDMLSTNRMEVNSPAPQLSNSAILTSQQTKDLKALKRSSTHMRPPQSETSQPPGDPTKTRRLRPTATLLPSKSSLAPQRRRRSPPKEGRRFIPLLDSEDESSIASP